MPNIRPSSDLRNRYNEISEFVISILSSVYNENGKGDLVVMSIQTFERLVGKFELCKLLDEGMDAMKNNRVIPAEDVFKQIESSLDA